MKRSIPENHTQYTLDFEALNTQPIDTPTISMQPYSPARQCNVCFIVKPLTDFHVSKGSKNGRVRTCKGCCRQKQQLHRVARENLPPKQCDTCLETKPLSDFGRNTQHSDKKQSTCKRCIMKIARPKTIPPPKQCTACLEMKPHADFGRNDANPDRRQERCKECIKQSRYHKEIAEPGQLKQCNTCQEMKPLTDFNMSSSRNRFGVVNQCKICLITHRRERRKTHPPKKYLRVHDYESQRANKLRHKFGLTMKQYDEMFVRQNGVCALCGNPETAIDSRKKRVRMLAVDHCHATGTIRELLCQSCNMMLGFSKDDTELLRRAADYVERHR